MSLVYVAQPYSHESNAVMHYRMTVGALYVAHHMDKRDQTFYSPICHGVPINTYCSVGSTFHAWRNHNFGMLTLADSVHVLLLKGHERSVGLKAELELATKQNKPIRYFRVSGTGLDKEFTEVFV